jgi:hypothetical protein
MAGHPATARFSKSSVAVIAADYRTLRPALRAPPASGDLVDGAGSVLLEQPSVRG